MNISLNAVAFRNGKPFNTTLNLTKQSDGSWHATNFDKAMQGAYNASKGGAAQSRNVDTYTPEVPVRTELSDKEIAELAGKYDPRNMTQDQYNKFLDDLIEKGALSRFDAMRLGHNGWRILDINPDSFATGGIGCGTAYATSADGSDGGPIRSLEDADGDLIRWLESMLAQEKKETGSKGGNSQKVQVLDTLSDIIKRMQAV